MRHRRATLFLVAMALATPSGHAFAQSSSVLAKGIANAPLGDDAASVGSAARSLARAIAKSPTVDSAFRPHADGPRNVALHRMANEVAVKPGVQSRPYAFTSDMMLDTDGRSALEKTDKTGQSTTSLTDSRGRALDTTETPWVVLPESYKTAMPGMKLGDIVAVVHDGKVVYGIFGDSGPSDQLGEASIKVAEQFPDIANAPKGLDPNVGGDDKNDVTYIAFPGSGDGKLLSNAEIQSRGAALMAQLTKGAASAPSPTRGVVGALGGSGN